MNFESLTNYIRHMFYLIKNDARKAKIEADHSLPEEKDYHIGVLMAYYAIVSMIKNHAHFYLKDARKLGPLRAR